MCLRSNSSYTSVMHTSGKKVQIRKPAPGQSDIAPLRRSSRPVIISSSTLKKTPAQQRPLRERLIHLLALKPYKKPELILRLQKDGLLPSDKDSLDSHLQQVTLTHTHTRSKTVLSSYPWNANPRIWIHPWLLCSLCRWQTWMGETTPSHWRTFFIRKFRRTGQATQKETSSFSKEFCLGMSEMCIIFT